MESTPSHALVKLKNGLKRDWGPRRFKIVPKPCEQQKRGSNDCGLACVNAAATLVGGRLLSREDCGAIILGIAPENIAGSCRKFAEEDEEVVQHCTGSSLSCAMWVGNVPGQLCPGTWSSCAK
jgi:hypothetical protein